MRRSREQEAQQARWESNDVDLAQGVVLAELSLDAIRLRVPDGVRLTPDTKVEWSEAASHERLYKPLCLQHFLTLTTATPEQVVAFAQAWGVLVAEEEHRLETQEELDATPQKKTHWDKPEEWTRLASEMEALIELTSYLSEGQEERSEAAARKAWILLTQASAEGRAIPFPELSQQRAEHIKALVGTLATSLLGDVGAAPLVGWKGATPGVRLWMPDGRWQSLKAALVVNLAAVIGNPARAFRCGICKRRNFKRHDQRMPRTGGKFIPLCESQVCKKKHQSNKSNAWNKGKREALASAEAPTPP